MHAQPVKPVATMKRLEPLRPAARLPDPVEGEPVPDPATVTTSSRLLPFDAELDMTEIDERGRCGPTWTGRAEQISRSSLAFRSRKMCYTGRCVVALVHLIDGEPTPLCGVVRTCEYAEGSQYRVTLQLEPTPTDNLAINAWVAASTRKK